MLRPLAFCLCVLAVTACAPEIPGGEPAPASASSASLNEPTTSIGGIDLSRPLKFTGTEPFWSLSVSEDDIIMERPDTAPRHFTPGHFHMNGNSAELRSTDLSVSVTAKACSDGMSDREYPLTATVRVAETIYQGCAMATADMAKDHP